MQKDTKSPDELTDLVDLFNDMTDGRKRDYDRAQREMPPPAPSEPATPSKPMREQRRER